MLLDKNATFQNRYPTKTLHYKNATKAKFATFFRRKSLFIIIDKALFINVLNKMRDIVIRYPKELSLCHKL